MKLISATPIKALKKTRYRHSNKDSPFCLIFPPYVTTMTSMYGITSQELEPSDSISSYISTVPQPSDDAYEQVAEEFSMPTTYSTVPSLSQTTHLIFIKEFNNEKAKLAIISDEVLGV